MTSVDIASRCRICFEESNLHCNIYRKKGSDLKCIADIINDLCDLDVREDDGYPQYICGDCSIKLCEFKCFKQKSRTTKSILLLLKQDNTHSKSTPAVRSTREKKTEPTKDECDSLFEDIILVVHKPGDHETQTITELDDQTKKLKSLPQKRTCSARAVTKRSRRADTKPLSTTVNEAGDDEDVNTSAEEPEEIPLTNQVFVKEETDLDGDERNDEDNEEDDSSSLTDGTGGVNVTLDPDATPTSIRNKPKLIHNGFMYTFDKLSSDRSRKYWRCDRKSTKCYGRVHTTLEGTFICEITKHNHESDRAAINSARLRHLILKLALETDDPVEEVVNKVLQGFTIEELKDLPSKEAMRKMVRRRRAQRLDKASRSISWD